VTFPGSGIAALAASEANLSDIKAQLTFQTIGYDKLNQMRHVAYFGDIDGLRAHMEKQAELIRPKFTMLNELLTNEIASRGLGSWVNPKGGYFICFESLDGCAKEIVAKCKEAGVTMTGAGAPFPYGKDPKDNVIRIAPTYPSLADLTKAAEVFVTVVRLVSAEKMLEKTA
jgi:DNA-binding transcriptional MocR family regulator